MGQFAQFMEKSNEALRIKLISAITTYDKKQSKKTSYNPHALALYIAGIDEVVELKNKGISIEKAISDIFSDQLADACLKAIKGESKE